MPCQDITEVIELTFDPDDRLVSYRLNKRTCGAQIGEAALLQAFLAQRTMANIAALDAACLPHFYQERGQPIAVDAEFLYFKHLLAVQEAVRVLGGEAAGGPGALCCTAAVVADAQGLHYTGFIAVDAVTQKIKSCGGCGGCGSARKSVAKTPPTL